MRRADFLLAPILRNIGISEDVHLLKIKMEWSEIFEKPLSFHTSPAALKESELLINVDSAVWMQELSFYKETIVKKLNRFGIKSVRLKIGRVFPYKKQSGPKPEMRRMTIDDKAFIENTVSVIPEEDLKVQIKKAIEKSLTFKRSA
ncbi:MAG: DUF721 domain-containing protein [Nitrospiraceae bacterium]|nr:DUF721 domain-containing protein [Nitrospiraceae bacterium]